MFKLFQELKPLTDQLPSEEDYRKKEPGGGASMSQYAAAMEIALRVKKAMDFQQKLVKNIALKEAATAFGTAALLYNINLCRASDLPENVKEEARRLARETVLSYADIRDEIKEIMELGHAAEVAADIFNQAYSLHCEHAIPYRLAKKWILDKLEPPRCSFESLTAALKPLILQRRRRKYYTIVLSTILILYILIIILY